MSQQINLLRSKSTPQLAVYTAAGLLGAGVIGVLVYAAVHSHRLSAAREQLVEAQQQTQRMKKAIEAAELARRAPDGIQALDDEIAQLTARVQIAAPLFASIESGAAGDAQGYSKHFGLLAGVPRDEVWITGAEIARGGKQMVLVGRAMRNDQAVSYAQRLRQSFEPVGVRFNSIELLPEMQPGSTPEKPRYLVTFKIS